MRTTSCEADCARRNPYDWLVRQFALGYASAMRETAKWTLLAVWLAPAVAQGSDLTVVVSSAGLPVADAVVLLRQSGLAPNATTMAVMDQVEFQFAPFVLPVRPGTAVTFPNSDNVRHQVYSFSAAKRFELPLYSGTPAAPVIFPAEGIVTLGCNIHDWMIGFIVVDAAPVAAVTGADGRASFTGLADETVDIAVWHPRMGPDAVPVALAHTLAGDAVLTVELVLGPPVRRASPAAQDSATPTRRRRP